MSNPAVVSVPVDSSLTHFRLPECLGSNNAQVVATGTHTLKFAMAWNGDTDACRLKLYDKATTPDPSTDTPVIVIPIPQIGSGWRGDSQSEVVFFNGIAMALVKGAADNDNTAPSAGMITDLEITYR